MASISVLGKGSQRNATSSVFETPPQAHSSLGKGAACGGGSRSLHLRAWCRSRRHPGYLLFMLVTAGVGALAAHSAPR